MSSSWHTVSPASRPLQLSVLELSPLALTLALSLATSGPQSHPTHNPSAHHIAHTHHGQAGLTQSRKRRTRTRHDSDDELTAFEGEEDAHLAASPSNATSSAFKDLLSHGVVVSVNGQSWTRIFAHVSEEAENLVGEVEHEPSHAVDEDWEDEMDHAEEGLEDSHVTQRRPRKARFHLSASDALRESGTRHPEQGGRLQRIGNDKALVIIYGLSAGQEYEIDLQVMGPTADAEPISGCTFLSSIRR